MSTRKRKSFIQLPTALKVIYSICLVMALIGLSLSILDIMEVINDSLHAGQFLCTLTCLISALSMSKYRDQLYEE